MAPPVRQANLLIPERARLPRKPPRGKQPYVKPRVEQAGSVFDRTRALGSGTKDALISGSILL